MTLHTTNIEKLMFKLQGIQTELDALILATPTSPARDSLCDANIVLMRAQSQLAKPSKTS